MRHCLSIAAAFLALQTPAFASSIEVVGAHAGGGSIVVKSCGDCPSHQAGAKKNSYIVPTLKQGTQTVEIREINGEKKMVRTEAWMGGSPVVYVGKAPDTENAADKAVAATPAAPVAAAAAVSIEAQAVEPAQKAGVVPAADDGVDPSATTSALSVHPEAGADLQVEAASAPQALDASKFELRLQ